MPGEPNLYTLLYHKSQGHYKGSPINARLKKIHKLKNLGSRRRFLDWPGDSIGEEEEEEKKVRKFAVEMLSTSLRYFHFKDYGAF